MISNNPFATLSVYLPSIVMQGFVILMIVLVILGTLFDIIHKKCKENMCDKIPS